MITRLLLLAVLTIITSSAGMPTGGTLLTLQKRDDGTSDSGLSLGTRVAIGITIPLGLIGSCFSIWLRYNRRQARIEKEVEAEVTRRLNEESAKKAEVVEMHGKAELSGVTSDVHEMLHEDGTIELGRGDNDKGAGPGPENRHELDGEHEGSGLLGSKRHELGAGEHGDCKVADTQRHELE